MFKETDGRSKSDCSQLKSGNYLSEVNLNQEISIVFGLKITGVMS